ncbi:MAG: PQQ-binding-like beta-propeller repeat protein, partial [Chloroflexota bacterium]
MPAMSVRSRAPRIPAWRWFAGTLLALCLAAASLPSLGTLAAVPQPTEWTRYHVDPSNNALVNQLGAAPVAWRSPNLGQEVYTVAVVGNRVYGDGVKGKPTAFALDRATGKLLWSTPLDNGAMSQPLVIGNRVFIGSGNQTYFYRKGIQYFGTGSNSIYALDTATGKVLWRLPLQGEAMPTPVYQDGALYWVTGERRFLAIDAVTGHVTWQLALPSFMSMSSPAQYGNLLIFGGARTYNEFAVDIKNHKLAWQYKWGSWKGLPITNGVDDCPPAVANGMVFCNGSASVDPDRRPGGVIRQFAWALDAKTGKLLWLYDQGNGHRTKFNAGGVPTAVGNVVYVEAPGSHGLDALDQKTGRLIWKATLGASDRSGSIVDGSALYIADDAGTLYHFDAKTGKLLWLYDQ